MAGKPVKTSIPSRVGSWVIKDSLGEGGFGLVLSAERRQVNGEKQYAAIKLMKHQNRDDPQLIQMFMHEFDVLKRLDTPYIAKVLDSGQEVFEGEVLLWFATELVKGENLRKEIASEGILDKSQWLELAHDLLAAAAVTHEAGVVHLDIKPDNLMRFSRRSILVDFGGASYVAVADPGDAGVRSIEWCAPEQIDGISNPADHGYEVDIFAIGTTLVFAGTGLLPWEVEKTDQLGRAFRSRLQFEAAHHHKVTSSPPRLDGLDVDQKSIVEKMLETSQAMRPTAVELLNMVKDLLPDGSIRKLEDIRARPTRSVAPRYKMPENRGFKQAVGEAARKAAEEAVARTAEDGLRLAAEKAVKKAARETALAAARSAREQGWFYNYGTSILLPIFTLFIGPAFRFGYLERQQRNNKAGLLDRKINAYILTFLTWGFATPFMSFSWWRSTRRLKFLFFFIGQLSLVAAMVLGSIFSPHGSRVNLDPSLQTPTEQVAVAVMSLAFLAILILGIVMVGQTPEFKLNAQPVAETSVSEILEPAEGHPKKPGENDEQKLE